jgi:Tetratricopeptide repeat
MKTICYAAALVLLCWCITAHAVEIRGTVRSATAESATIAIEGQLVPTVGDPVEIFFKMPGVDEEISVGNGKVTAVNADAVEVKIDKATGTVSKDQLAKITSEKPQKRNATASPSAVPTSATGETSPSPKGASKLLGRWGGEDPSIKDMILVFKNDGSVIVPVPVPKGPTGLVGKFTVDSATTPTRFEITNFEYVPPPNLTDEEVQAFQRQAKEVKETVGASNADFKKFIEGNCIGEIESASRLRMKVFTKEQATTQPRVEGEDVMFFKKLAPGEGLAPSSSDSTYQKAFGDGVARYNEDDYDGAIAAYTKAIEANPNDSVAYYNRALCYEQKREWAKSMEDLDRAISMNANLGPAYVERARVRIEMKDWQSAFLDDCNKALALLPPNDAPKNALAYAARGIYYAHEGAMKLAEADWKKAITLNPAIEEKVKEARAFFRESRKESSRRKR